MREVVYSAILHLVTEPGDVKSRLKRAKEELGYLNKDELPAELKQQWVGLYNRLNQFDQLTDEYCSALAGRLFIFWQDLNIIKSNPGI